MGDPLVDEWQLMETLNVPATLTVIERLQSGSILALVDGFDRQIKREPFINLTGAAFSLHGHLGRLHIVARINELSKQGKLTPERLNDAEIQLIDFCENERQALRGLAALVVQCPTSATPVH